MARFATLAVCAAALLLAVAAGGAAAQGVGSVITQSVYDTMLPNRDNSLCASGFYTYDAFIAAAAAFPSFGTTGSADDVKRELAAFFGQTSHETTGGTPGAADQFQWGYCFKEEKMPTSPPYQGRGPIQLTGIQANPTRSKHTHHVHNTDLASSKTPLTLLNAGQHILPPTQTPGKKKAGHLPPARERPSKIDESHMSRSPLNGKTWVDERAWQYLPLLQILRRSSTVEPPNPSSEPSTKLLYTSHQLRDEAEALHAAVETKLGAKSSNGRPSSPLRRPRPETLSFSDSWI